MFGFISNFVSGIGDFFATLFKLPNQLLQTFGNVYIVLGYIFGEVVADLIVFSILAVTGFVVIYSLVKLVLSLI